MTTIKLITDQVELAKEIKSLAGRAKKLDADFQLAALSAISIFEEHGNVFYINALYKALGKGARHEAMTAWLLQYGGVSANEGETKDTTPFVKDRNKTVNMLGATAMPWYNMKPSKKPDEVVDVLKLLMAVLKKASGDGKEIAHKEMLPELQQLASKYNAGEGATNVDPLAGVADEDQPQEPKASTEPAPF